MITRKSLIILRNGKFRIKTHEIKHSREKIPYANTNKLEFLGEICCFSWAGEMFL